MVANRKALVEADFARDPAALGWAYEAPAEGQGDGTWALGSDGGRLVATRGAWLSPAFGLAPGEYAELSLDARSAGPAFWVADFFDARGERLTADHYSSLDACPDWTRHRFCFRQRLDGRTGRLGLRPIDGRRLEVRSVRLIPIDRGAAAEWADGVYSTIPPLRYTPEAGRLEPLSRTTAACARGGRLRVVMLGDSAINDLANAAIDVRIERHYPGLRLDLAVSVAGSVGGWHYREQGRIRGAVLAHRPDLLVIGGISNCHGGRSAEEGVEALRDVVRQVRAEQCPDILLMTGAVGRGDARQDAGWVEEARIGQAGYRSLLKAMAADEGAAYLDLEGVWGNYLRSLTLPRDFFLRDGYHANERGRQALASVVERFFAP